MMPQRPSNFTLNIHHPLAKGLVFAGLGAHAGSTRYHDSSVFGNTGTLTNMDPATDWLFDKTLNRFVLDFVAASAQSVIGPTTALPSGYGVTLACWANRRTVNATAVMLCKHTTDTPYGVVINGTNGAKLSGGISTTGADFTTITGGTSVSASVWYHCVVTHDAANINLYLNGVSDASAVVLAGLPNLASTAALRVANRAGSTAYFNGQLGDPMLWNRALSLHEIKQVADPSNAMLSGLLQYPRRKWWPVVSGAAPTFKAAWAANRRQVIGGGVI